MCFEWIIQYLLKFFVNVFSRSDFSICKTVICWGLKTRNCSKWNFQIKTFLKLQFWKMLYDLICNMLSVIFTSIKTLTSRNMVVFAFTVIGLEKHLKFWWGTDINTKSHFLFQKLLYSPLRILMWGSFSVLHICRVGHKKRDRFMQYFSLS